MDRRLLVIVIAQLFGTSLWFSANAAAADLGASWGVGASELGYLSTAVQLGFIVGTALVSLSGVADRVPASRVFAVASLVGALANAAFALVAQGLGAGLAFRFATGVALAGIYPMGMKLVVGWVPEQKITVAEAIECYTRSSAFAAHQEKDLGTLGVGKLADFVVLSRDILAPAERENIARTRVLMTVVGGRVVHVVDGMR